MRGTTRSCGAFWLSASWGSSAFIYEERIAAEPIIPLSLFRNRSFLLCSLIGFVIGMSLFGSVTFLPLYLQVVKEATPTEAGLQLIPLMGGLLLTSIISGRVISHTGKYRIFPDYRYPARRDRHGAADPHHHTFANVAVIPVYRRARRGPRGW